MTPIKHAIKTNGRTNKWLAQKCGTDEGTMSQIVNDKHAAFTRHVRIALILAKELGVTVEELWGRLLEDELIDVDEKSRQ